MRSFHWNACSFTISFSSKCTILTFALQMFDHLFCYKKNLSLTKGRTMSTWLTAISSNQLSWSKLLAVTLFKFPFQVSKQKKLFPKWGKDLFSFYQPLNAGVLICSLYFVIKHTTYTLTSSFLTLLSDLSMENYYYCFFKS